jgi:hypothetical protein
VLIAFVCHQTLCFSYLCTPMMRLLDHYATRILQASIMTCQLLLIIHSYVSYMAAIDLRVAELKISRTTRRMRLRTSTLTDSSTSGRGKLAFVASQLPGRRLNPSASCSSPQTSWRNKPSRKGPDQGEHVRGGMNRNEDIHLRANGRTLVGSDICT